MPAHLTLASFRHRRLAVNPLPGKIIIYMLPFPVIEGVLPFMESHLTLCSLHKGQTSQDNFAGAAAALEALTDICESPQLVSGKTRDGKCANFLPFLPLTGRRPTFFRKLSKIAKRPKEVGYKPVLHSQRSPLRSKVKMTPNGVNSS